MCQDARMGQQSDVLDSLSRCLRFSDCLIHTIPRRPLASLVDLTSHVFLSYHGSCAIMHMSYAIPLQIPREILTYPSRAARETLCASLDLNRLAPLPRGRRRETSYSGYGGQFSRSFENSDAEQLWSRATLGNGTPPWRHCATAWPLTRVPRGWIGVSENNVLTTCAGTLAGLPVPASVQ